MRTTMSSLPTHPTSLRRWPHTLLATLLAVLGEPRYWLIIAWVLTMIAIPIIRWVVGDASCTGASLLVCSSRPPPYWSSCRAPGVPARPTRGRDRHSARLAGRARRQHHRHSLRQLSLHPGAGSPPWRCAAHYPHRLAYDAARCVGCRRCDHRSRARLALLGRQRLAFTAWDLFLDPQMVGWGYWVWAEPGGYFGIPWINFFGWFVASALITFAVRPQQPPITPLLAIYTITWFLQTVGQALFWNMLGPALVGFVGMGIFVVLSIRSRTQQSQHTMKVARMRHAPCSTW